MERSRALRGDRGAGHSDAGPDPSPRGTEILNEARNHSTASTLRSPPEGVSDHRNLDSRKAVSTELVGGSDLDPPVQPVDALSPFQVRGEVFHVRLPASAVGSELT